MTFTNSSRFLSILTIVAIIGTLAVNSLSNFFPPGGKNVGEIANTTLSGVLITPANYAFIIWGVIYIGLIAYGVYQFQQRRRREIRQASGWLIAACVIQIGWIYLFTLQQFWLSVVAMLGILFSLMQAYRALEIGRFRVSSRRWWMAHAPFGLYLGWISVATVVNVASALYASGWSGWGLSDAAWTVIMLLVSGAIAALVIWRRIDPVFTGVFVWAYVAILIRQQAVPSIWITAAVVAAGLEFWWVYRKISAD
ncbi:MAG: tryptophan-rich sensory protein [Leptolyngbya sp. SIO4C1]|nr:tryptophan-rich sensory protein [Leptolyngbya sp. SIO4C1]